MSLISAGEEDDSGRYITGQEEENKQEQKRKKSFRRLQAVASAGRQRNCCFWCLSANKLTAAGGEH